MVPTTLRKWIAPKGDPQRAFWGGGGIRPLGRKSNGIRGDPYDSAIWLPCSIVASTSYEATSVPIPKT